LTVRIPPAIGNQPASLVVTQGQSATFSVTATGDPTLSYQWRFGMPGVTGGDLPGGTNSTLTVTNAQSTNAGNYRVIVSNSVGTTNSVVATLTVLGELVLDYHSFTTNGYLGLMVFPSVAQPYALDASSTLTNWTPIFTNQSGASGSNFIQAPITNTPHRFFRGRRWP